MSMEWIIRRYLNETTSPANSQSQEPNTSASNPPPSRQDPRVPTAQLDPLVDDGSGTDSGSSGGSGYGDNNRWDERVDSFDPPRQDPRVPTAQLDPLVDDGSGGTVGSDLIRGLTPYEHEVERIRAGMAGYGYDPSIGWIHPHPSVTTTRAVTLNSVSPRTQSEQSLQLAGDGALVGIPLGRVRVGARLLSVWDDSSGQELILLLGWGAGMRTGVEAIEAVYINGEDKTSETTWWTHYTAQPGAGNYNTVDPTIFAVDGTYADTGVYAHPDTSNNVGDAYSVLALPYYAKVDGFPECEAILQGLRFYDNREVGHVLGTPTTWEYTTNPSVILGNVLYSPEFGAGLTVDWDSVDTMADINDGLVNGKARHSIGLFLQENNSLESVIEALRAYAGCFVKVEGGTAYLVPDRPASVSRTLTTDEIADTIQITAAQTEPVPSHVRVWYSNRDQEPWRDDYAEYDRSGGDYALTEIYMRGFDKHERAYRFAKDWVNHRLLDTFNFQYETTARGAKDTPGDRLAINHPIGNLVNYDIRLIQLRMAEPGVWTHRGLTYDAAAYTDDDVTTTPAPTPQLPDPLAAVNPTGVTFVVNNFVSPTFYSQYAMRLDIPASGVWIFTDQFKIELIKDPTGADETIETRFENYGGDDIRIRYVVEPDTDYKVEITAIGQLASASSPYSTATVTSSDVDIVPNAPSNVTAEQVTNDVLLNWDNPTLGFIGGPDPNIRGWAVRRGTTSQNPLTDWGSMTVITELVDVTQLLVSDPPLGSQRYVVRSVSNQSNSLSISFEYDDIDVLEVTNTNLIYLGDFPTWSEGTSFTPSSGVDTYVADLWIVYRNAANYTVSRQSARTNGLGRYSLRLQRDSGDTSTSAPFVSYAFESEEIVGFRGKKVSVDFWIQTGANYSRSDPIQLRLRTSDTVEGTFRDMLTGGTTQDLELDGTDLPNIAAGANSWTRITGYFPNAVSNSAIGLAIAIRPRPTGTAGANDWIDVTEVQVFIGEYFESLDSNEYKQAPDFIPPPSSTVASRVRRYLKYTQQNSTPADEQWDMRALPTEDATGAPPYKYDARL